MKVFIFLTWITLVLSFGVSCGQPTSPGLTNKNKTLDTFEYTFKSAHPNAKALMKEEFYWSPIEETAPFSSDDGFDAAYGFLKWRDLNKTESPVKFLKQLIQSWQYPFFNYNEMDTTKIKEYLNQEETLDEATIQERMQTLKQMNKKSPDSARKMDDKDLRKAIVASTKNMSRIYLLGQDNAIIAIGFAQFVLEGHMNNQIKSLTITAIERQLLPLLINSYADDYRNRRKSQLEKMLAVAKKAKS